MDETTKTKLIWAVILTAIGGLLPIAVREVSILLDFNPNIFIQYYLLYYPMYILVILCGIICGYKLGAISGIVVTLLTTVPYGTLLSSTATYLGVMLMTYGLISGLLIKKVNIIFTITIATIGGLMFAKLVRYIIWERGSSGTSTLIKDVFTYLGDVLTTPSLYIQIVAEIIIVSAIIIILKKIKLLPMQGRREAIE